MSYVAIKYVHLLAIMILFASFARALRAPSLAYLLRTCVNFALIDGIYGGASAVALGAGLTLCSQSGKVKTSILQNHLFHLKLGLFAVLGLLSVYPTIFFLKHRKPKRRSLRSRDQ